MEAVYKLGYTDTPNYSKLKELFTKQLKSLGCSSDGGESLDWITSKKVGHYSDNEQFSGLMVAVYFRLGRRGKLRK